MKEKDKIQRFEDLLSMLSEADRQMEETLRAMQEEEEEEEEIEEEET